MPNKRVRAVEAAVAAVEARGMIEHLRPSWWLRSVRYAAGEITREEWLHPPIGEFRVEEPSPGWWGW